MSSLEGETDRELMSRLSAGDEDVYAYIFHNHYQMMYAAALRLTQRPALAKDACQEVFLNVWNNRTRLKSDMIIGAYLRTSVVNRSLNKIKSAHHHQGAHAPREVRSLAAQESPDLIVEAKDLEDLINSTIDNLPDKCRAVFILSRYENLTYRQIADQLDISIRTVEHHISKALKILKKAIADYQ